MNPWRSILILTILGHFLFTACQKKEENEPKPSTDTKKEYTFPSYFGVPLIPKDIAPLEEDVVELGRKLFYDPILSSDSTVSCASCHKQEFAFSDNKLFSEGVGGRRTSRHSMSITNMAWQTRFFWDGRAASLEEQAIIPIENVNEMNLPIEEALERLNKSPLYDSLFQKVFEIDEIEKKHLATAISHFERSLISQNSKFDKHLKKEYQLTEQEERGRVLFFTHPEPGIVRGGNCGDCHASPQLMVQDFHNNGLDKYLRDDGLGEFTGNENDNGKFKTPSLRNIGYTAPYMHDGRFQTLREVLDHYNEHIQFESPNLDPQIIAGSNNCNGCPLGLTDQEKEDILAFLKLLDDEEFVNNDDFSNPFE